MKKSKKKNLARKLLLSAFPLFAFCSFATYSNVAEANKNTPTKSGSAKEDFSVFAEKLMKEVLKTVRRKHYDDKIADWEKISAEFLPKVRKCKKQRELLDALNKMVKSLGQSHIYVLPPKSEAAKKVLQMHRKSVSATPAPRKSDKKKKSVPGDPGLRFCMADGKVCVLNVKKNSSAEKAGVKMGDVLLAVENIKINPEKYSDLPWDALAERILVGKSGNKVKISLQGVKGKTRDITLEREPNGFDWIKLGIMPKTPGKFEYKKLPENIAYIYFSPFYVKQIEKIQRLAGSDLKDARALVIDIRNNPGGMLTMLQALGGWLSEKAVNFGSMPTRDTTLYIQSNPQKDAFTGPIAILINKGSVSASEIFAAGMQDDKRAVTVGQGTPGMCLPSSFVLLSGDYRLQTVFGDFIRANGERIEKKGVKPDMEVKITRADLTKGKDPVLEKGIELLSKKRHAQKPHKKIYNWKNQEN